MSVTGERDQLSDIPSVQDTSLFSTSISPSVVPNHIRVGANKSGEIYSLLEVEEQEAGIVPQSVDIEVPPTDISSSDTITTCLARCTSSLVRSIRECLLYLAPPASLPHRCISPAPNLTICVMRAWLKIRFISYRRR